MDRRNRIAEIREESEYAVIANSPLTDDNLAMGDRIIFDAFLTRVNGGQVGRFWQIHAQKPREGVYIGWRVLSNGSYSEETGKYHSGCHFKAALIVYDLKKAPTYVHFGALKRVSSFP